MSNGKTMFLPTDSVTQGFAKMYASHKVDPRLVVGSQILIDTLTTLSNASFNSFRIPTDLAMWLLQNVTEHSNVTEAINDPTNADLRSIKLLLENCLVVASNIGLGNQDLSNKKVTGRIAANIQTENDGFWLYQYHPLLCGKVMFHLRWTMNTASLKLANLFRLVVPMLHLYQAARRFGYSKVKWGLAEKLKEFQDTMHLLLPDEMATLSLSSFGNCLHVTQGMSAVTYSKNARKGKGGKFSHARANINNVLVLRSRMPTLDILRERYSLNARTTPGMTSAKIEVTIRKAKMNNLADDLTSMFSGSPRGVVFLQDLVRFLTEEEKRLLYKYLSMYCEEPQEQVEGHVLDVYPRLSPRIFDVPSHLPKYARGTITVCLIFALVANADEKVIAKSGIFQELKAPKKNRQSLAEIGSVMDKFYEAESYAPRRSSPRRPKGTEKMHVERYV